MNESGWPSVDSLQSTSMETKLGVLVYTSSPFQPNEWEVLNPGVLLWWKEPPWGKKKTIVSFKFSFASRPLVAALMDCREHQHVSLCWSGKSFFRSLSFSHMSALADFILSPPDKTCPFLSSTWRSLHFFHLIVNTNSLHTFRHT